MYIDWTFRICTHIKIRPIFCVASEFPSTRTRETKPITMSHVIPSKKTSTLRENSQQQRSTA